MRDRRRRHKYCIDPAGVCASRPKQRQQPPPGGKIYNLKAQAQTLAQQPGLAWLGDLAKRDDVDWQKIELAQQSWDYKQAGLTKEGAAVVSLINKQGDVGKTLHDLGSKDNIKQLFAAILTAGIGLGLTSAMGLPSLSAAPSFANRFATYATKTAAGVQSAVFGTPLSETAKTALVNSLAQTLTSEISDWCKSDNAIIAKTIAHAVVQSAAASVLNKDCGSTALGVVVAEAIFPMSELAAVGRTRPASGAKGGAAIWPVVEVPPTFPPPSTYGRYGPSATVSVEIPSHAPLSLSPLFALAHYVSFNLEISVGRACWHAWAGVRFCRDAMQT